MSNLDPVVAQAALNLAHAALAQFNTLPAERQEDTLLLIESLGGDKEAELASRALHHREQARLRQMELKAIVEGIK